MSRKTPARTRRQSKDAAANPGPAGGASLTRVSDEISEGLKELVVLVELRTLGSKVGDLEDRIRWLENANPLRARPKRFVPVLGWDGQPAGGK